MRRAPRLPDVAVRRLLDPQLRSFNERGARNGHVPATAIVSLAVASRKMLVQLGTNVSPLRPTTVLATDGIYKWTRNPLYTGGTLVMFGIALIFALDWLVLLIVVSRAVNCCRSRAA